MFGPLKTFVASFPSKGELAKKLTCNLVILSTANCGLLVYDSSFPGFDKTLGVNQLRERNFYFGSQFQICNRSHIAVACVDAEDHGRECCRMSFCTL